MPDVISGAEEELAFWRGAIHRYKADPAKSPFRLKLDPNRAIQPRILERILFSQLNGCNTARVLDVGCGPLSTIGKKAEGMNLEIVGLDPLAAEYQELLKNSDLVSPHESFSGTAENASECFGKSVFDYVHAENSLDHCQDAGKALSELQKVCKPDAIFFFRVFVNEGEHNHYSGFHQWNFDVYEDKVIFWRPGQIHFIDEVFQLPINFWIDEQTHGPKGVRRKYLNCEVHNTDMQHNFSKVGGVNVRLVPEFGSIVLRRNSDFVPDCRVFVHFGFDGEPRKVKTLAWPLDQDHYVLDLPKNKLRSIKIGQSRAYTDALGRPGWGELWSEFVRNFSAE